MVTCPHMESQVAVAGTQTPVDIFRQAFERGNWANVEALLSVASHIDFNQHDDDGNSPLIFAINGGVEDIIIRMIEIGVDLTVKTKSGEFAHEVAARQKNWRVAYVLSAALVRQSQGVLEKQTNDLRVQLEDERKIAVRRDSRLQAIAADRERRDSRQIEIENELLDVDRRAVLSLSRRGSDEGIRTAG